MTDKIIINGIDVSKCSNYDQDSYFECKNSCCHCDEIPNCYFKQLKRAEQKLEIAKQGLNLILTVQEECTKCPHQELDIDVLVCDLDCATAFKKIAKQTLKTIEDEDNV